MLQKESEIKNYHQNTTVITEDSKIHMNIKISCQSLNRYLNSLKEFPQDTFDYKGENKFTVKKFKIHL